VYNDKVLICEYRYKSTRKWLIMWFQIFVIFSNAGHAKSRGPKLYIWDFHTRNLIDTYTLTEEFEVSAKQIYSWKFSSTRILLAILISRYNDLYIMPYYTEWYENNYRRLHALFCFM
jgi:hypothetical protein